MEKGSKNIFEIHIYGNEYPDDENITKLKIEGYGKKSDIRTALVITLDKFDDKFFNVKKEKYNA